MRILLVDDDRNISKMVQLYLEKEGYTVLIAYDGKQAVKIYEDERIDLVLLDVMMPEMDGLETLKEIRRLSNKPVIMLTAKSETFDKVLALELGADDYVVKPFDPKELVARIKAISRRSSAKEDVEKILHFDKLIINMSDYTIKYYDENLELPPKEMELLYYLASRPNRVFTREQLLEAVWGYDYFGDTRTVDVHIKRLRDKFSKNHNWQINTVWGVGYKFEVK